MLATVQHKLSGPARRLCPHPPTHPPSSRSVRDQQVPPTGPSPGRACEGMCAASMPSETPWVMAMCTPSKRAPATMPA